MSLLLCCCEHASHGVTMGAVDACEFAGGVLTLMFAASPVGVHGAIFNCRSLSLCDVTALFCCALSQSLSVSIAIVLRIGDNDIVSSTIILVSEPA